MELIAKGAAVAVLNREISDLNRRRKKVEEQMGLTNKDKQLVLDEIIGKANLLLRMASEIGQLSDYRKLLDNFTNGRLRGDQEECEWLRTQVLATLGSGAWAKVVHHEEGGFVVCISVETAERVEAELKVWEGRDI